MIDFLINDLRPLPNDVFNYIKLNITDVYNVTENSADLEIGAGFDSYRIWIPKSQMRVDQNSDIWLTEWFANKSSIIQL